jgi:DnaK suppressor protein
MDDDERARIKDRILDEIAETEERIMGLEKATEAVAPDKGLGRLSRLEAMSDKSVNDAALAEARHRLEDLEVALTKVYQRDFGICVTCRQPIGLERITALPHASQCVACASKGRVR